MNKHCILISLLLCLFYANSFAMVTDNYKFKKAFQSTSGVVIFDHEAHAMGRVKDCEFCHSALKIFGGKVNELFAHNFCKVCHDSSNGPTECNGCHNGKQVPME